MPATTQSQTQTQPAAPLSALGTYDLNQVDADSIFMGDGHSLRLQQYRLRESRPYKAKLAATANFIAEVVSGRRPIYHLSEAMRGQRVLQLNRFGLQETMSTSDFSNLFGDVIDRQLLAQYTAVPPSWRSYCKVGRVQDFRTVNRFTLNGLRQPLSQLDQLENYGTGKVTDGKYSYAVSKYGRTVPLSWETLINDDLDAFAALPSLLSQSAINTEEDFVTRLLVNASGFLTSVFNNTIGNIVNTTNGAASTNPALGVQGLRDAMTVLMLQKEKDADGNIVAPIAVRGAILVVPPQLSILAADLVRNIQQISFGPTGSTTDTYLAQILPEWLKNLRVVTNYYLPVVNTSSNAKSTWFLFADPGSSRTCIEVGFLRGRENPELFMREPNARRLGGGTIDPTEGSFENDSVDYKLRHVFGGTVMDAKGVVVSNGTGS